MRSVIGGVLLALCCAGGVYGQAVAGSGALSGYILEDPDDGLPDSAVTITNPGLGVRRTVLTNDEGAFDVMGLPPGPGYKLTVTRKGFAMWGSAVFEVRVGRTLVFRVEMNKEKPSKNAKLYDVTSDVEDNQMGVLTWFSPVETKMLPSSGRKLDPLAAATPFTTIDAANGLVVFHADPTSAFLVDGIDVTNGYYGALPGIGGPYTQETIQEIQTLSAGYPAEFGRASGGQVNTVTTPGGNSFHGSGFGFVRGASFASPGQYALGNNLLGQRTQAGGSVGGPVVRDHIYFFAHIETLNDDFQGINRITTQTLTDSAGNTVLPSNCTATAAQCAAAIKFIQSQMNVITPFNQKSTSGTGRIDYRRSEVSSFNGEFHASSGQNPIQASQSLVAPDGGQLGINNTTTDTKYARVGWVATPRSNWVNELRLGMWDERLNDPASLTNLSTGNVGIIVAGANVGASQPNAQNLDERRYQVVENLNMSVGGHSFRVGVDASRTHDDIDALQAAGTYVYPTLTTFAQDFSGAGTTRSYTSFNQQFGTSAHLVQYKELNAYAQDTWKALSRLDITAGVRWDKTFLPQPSVTNPTYYQTSSIPSPNISFAPRIGVAYLFSDTLVLRLGYGFFYTPYTGQFLDALLQGNGLSQTTATVNPNMVGAPIFPKQLTFTTAPSGSSNLMYAVGKLRDPKTQQATIALEKRLARNTTVTLNLINSRAVKLWSGSDQNLAAPTKTGTYPIDNASGAVVGSYTTNIWTAKNDAKYARIFQVDNTNSSLYNGASLQVRQHLARGFSLEGSYTWSQATGTVTGPLVAGVFPLVTAPDGSVSDKGPLPYDQRGRGVVAWNWETKLTRSTSPAARYLVNGWVFTGIASFYSGQPITPTVLLSGNQFSTLTMAYFNSLNGSGGWNRDPTEPIGFLRTQAQRNVDARFGRTFPFTERVRASVAIEAFNLLNYQRATSLNSISYNALAVLPTGIINGPYNGALKPVPGVGAGNASTSFPDGISARRFQMAFRLEF
jgi:hypothetical protein